MIDFIYYQKGMFIIKIISQDILNNYSSIFLFSLYLFHACSVYCPLLIVFVCCALSVVNHY
jgi:hypothetical protein